MLNSVNNHHKTPMGMAHGPKRDKKCLASRISRYTHPSPNFKAETRKITLCIHLASISAEEVQLGLEYGDQNLEENTE